MQPNARQQRIIDEYTAQERARRRAEGRWRLYFLALCCVPVIVVLFYLGVEIGIQRGRTLAAREAYEMVREKNNLPAMSEKAIRSLMKGGRND